MEMRGAATRPVRYHYKLILYVHLSYTPPPPPHTLPIDSEEDLHLLVECLRYQQNCLSAQKQALATIATMCSNSSTSTRPSCMQSQHFMSFIHLDSSRNLFNSTGGLSYVLELLFESKCYELQQAVLYTLGCASENNREGYYTHTHTQHTTSILSLQL